MFSPFFDGWHFFVFTGIIITCRLLSAVKFTDVYFLAQKKAIREIPDSSFFIDIIL
jgi:hypothetical protein